MPSDLHRCISLLRGMITSIFFQEKVNFLKDYLTTSQQKTSTLLHFSNSDLFYLSSINLSIIYLYHIYSIFIISFYLCLLSLSLVTPIPYSFSSITPFSQFSCCSSLLFSPSPSLTTWLNLRTQLFCHSLVTSLSLIAPFLLLCQSHKPFSVDHPNHFPTFFLCEGP